MRHDALLLDVKYPATRGYNHKYNLSSLSTVIDLKCSATRPVFLFLVIKVVKQTKIITMVPVICAEYGLRESLICQKSSSKMFFAD